MAIADSDYSEAFNTAGKHLQACMNESGATFRWIKMRPSKPAFADLVFVCGQRMYAVLLAPMASQKKAEGGSGVSVRFEIPHEEHELLMQECERYHLEPVVFPLWIGIMQPLLSRGWNLFSLRDMQPIDPSAQPDMPPVLMSEWELCNFCVEQVLHELEEKRLRIFSYQDIPGVYPNLWFRDEEGRRAWVSVLTSFGREFARIPRETLDLPRKLPKECVGYIARMAVTAFDRPGAHPMRGDSLAVNYQGLERLP